MNFKVLVLFLVEVALTSGVLLSKRAFHQPALLNGVISRTNAVGAAILISLNPYIANAMETSVTTVGTTLVRTSPVSESLTASELLQSDVDFYVAELKDMSLVLSQVEGIIDNRDYEAVRGVLRQEPLRNLRKTSKALMKYLPSTDTQAKYEKAYQSMLDAVDDLDFKAIQRSRKEGIPKVGVTDTEFQLALKSVISRLDGMIKVAVEI